MKEEGIVFAQQLIAKLEENISRLEKAKKDNDPRIFNEIKKNSFDIHQEIGKML